MVAEGRVTAGPSVRAACLRHLHDRVDGQKRGLRWDADAAEHVIGFFPEVLRLPQLGTSFALADFQAFKTGSLFGWKRTDGPRRFRVAYIEEAKGNGKSPWCAGVGLYMLTADGERGAECYAAAVTRDQAQICFQDAVTMMTASPDLQERIQPSGKQHVYNLAHLRSGSFYRPISSEGRSLDGKRVHFAGIDEVHEHPTPVVVRKLKDGLKGRKQGLILMITNSGVDRQSICFQYHEYAKRILAGTQEDDEFFAFIADLDVEDDPFEDESCWVKANPNLGVSVTQEYLRAQVRGAKGMPAERSNVMRMNFCRWMDAENPWIEGDRWRGAEVEAVDLRERDVYAALDLSGTKDLTALALLAEGAGGRFDAKVEFWTPKDTLEQRSKDDKVPYSLWVDEGYVTATPGRTVDYAFVAKRLVEISQECNLIGVAFDPYRIKYLEKELDELGATINLVPHAQGYRKAVEKAGDGEAYNLWMPHSIALLEKLIDRHQLAIERNPCLTHCAASAVLEQDASENKIFAKRKSRGRIDGVVALAMDCGYALAGVESDQGDVDGWLEEPVTA